MSYAASHVTALLSIDNNNKTTDLMAFINMLHSSHFISLIQVYGFIEVFLYNLLLGLLKHLSRAVILMPKSLSKDRYLTFQWPKFLA